VRRDRRATLLYGETVRGVSTIASAGVTDGRLRSECLGVSSFSRRHLRSGCRASVSWRHTLAHGASCGLGIEATQARERGRHKSLLTYKGMLEERPLCRPPPRAILLSRRNPQLALWANAMPPASPVGRPLHTRPLEMGTQVSAGNRDSFPQSGQQLRLGFGRRLGATADLFRQKLFGGGVERHPVFRLREAVAFVRKQQVVDVLVFGA
jgi:hypothetical protein